jgi:hypothetical protein
VVSFILCVFYHNLKFLKELWQENSSHAKKEMTIMKGNRIKETGRIIFSEYNLLCFLTWGLQKSFA